MKSNQIYTVGHVFSNQIKKSFKIEALVQYLAEFGIKSVIDVRYINNKIEGSYAPDKLKESLNGAQINYFSRVEETYLFYEALKNKSDASTKLAFFQSHYFLPLINYLKSFDTNFHPVALLFNYWETKDWVINSGKMRTNSKGGLLRFIYKEKVDLNICHLAPRKKDRGLDSFSSQELFDFAYGSLLDIREDMEWKSRPNTFDDNDYEEDWGEIARQVGENEWRAMNEESDGAAYWNID